MNAVTRTLFAAASLAGVLASVASADIAAEADALLADRFDAAALAALDTPAKIDLWAETAGQALDAASEDGVERVMAALFDEALAAPVLDRVDVETAPALFGLLFHPALLEELVSESPARIAAWDAAADTLEDKYFARETTAVALAR